MSKWQTELALFLMEAKGCRNWRALLWTVRMAAFFVGGLLALIIIYNLETRLFPVVDSWQIISIERSGQHYTIAGKMHKRRPCEMLSTSILAVPREPLRPRVLLMQVRPHEIIGGEAPTGYVTWGPFRVDVPVALLDRRNEFVGLDVRATHRCHFLWVQETYYGFVPMERLP